MDCSTVIKAPISAPIILLVPINAAITDIMYFSEWAKMRPDTDISAAQINRNFLLPILST
jgi:hypothetical protein